ncbi:MAG: DUF711 family protein, partial [Anaerolineales bacterium]|nr:DUF711 family protein [Anaerolineales bacterium]
MKIRSATLFDNPGSTIKSDFLLLVEKFNKEAMAVFRDSDIELQTIRFATPPYPVFLKGMGSDQMIEYAIQLERTLKNLGYEYISLGPALPEYPESYGLIPDLIESTENTFCSGLMTDPAQGVSLPAVRSCGEIIHRLTPLDPNGFSNLYFAALGNVPAGAPFFPAAYHSVGQPSFAIAVEAADLAVQSFTGAPSFEKARSELTTRLEDLNARLVQTAELIEKTTGVEFTGIDYSLAPFPENELSIGGALEELGLKEIGQHGSLAAAAFLTDSIDRADIQRTGFSGLMLPVLEDSVLAERAAGGSLTVKDLLLYSAVCGTGLDTVPLPGDISADQISSILVDLAVLSLRCD